MAHSPYRHRTIVIVLVILLLIALALLLTRCLLHERALPPAGAVVARPHGAVVGEDGGPPAAHQPDELLTAAALTVHGPVTAGGVFIVEWTGPNNRGDYVTIVQADAPAEQHGNYRKTTEGSSLELTAPIDPGAHEVRYVTGRSHTILGRALVEVAPAGATLDAASEVVLGSQFPVTWTGPDNRGDYITIVSPETPAKEYGNYSDTARGSPLTLTAPTEVGDAELRYVTGQGRKVLARRTIRVIAADVDLSAPADAIAGTTIQVTWTGPDNAGDYITVVAIETPDGQYGNYTNTSAGSPLNLLIPIMAGRAELRYMAGQGHKVLARRPVDIVAAEVRLSAPAECAAGAAVSITWTGPNNPGDYITVVAKATPDGQYAAYTPTTTGSPLSVKAPNDAGDAEVRYMTGQGNRVLARIALKVNAP